ncbi:MAG TPA: DUF502 domain-containing protein [Gammaproteobacteria bacterium]|nr:DUF502 domain-containing protein [Gammaproteobacteria bacterium]
MKPGSRFKRYIATGLLVWIPLGVTIFVIRLVVQATDKLILLLPNAYRPETLLGFAIPGLGVVIGLLLLLLTGLIASNFVGRRLVRGWERLLNRIPFVRAIYSSAKQVAETIFSNKGQGFKTAVLAPFPQKGSWSVGFITSTELGELRAKTGPEMVGVFIPCAPPTQGFSIVVPRGDLIELNMTVDEALKYVMSLGVVVPPWPPVEKESKPKLAAAAERP